MRFSTNSRVQANSHINYWLRHVIQMILSLDYESFFYRIIYFIASSIVFV